MNDMTPEELEQLEEQLSAYVDGELTADERSKVEAALAESPEARQRLEELRQVSRLVGTLPRGEAPEDLHEALFARLEREQLYDSTETPTLAPATPPGALSFGRLVGAAAVILLAVLTGYLTIDFVQESHRRPVEIADAGKVGEPGDDLEIEKGTPAEDAPKRPTDKPSVESPLAPKKSVIASRDEDKPESLGYAVAEPPAAKPALPKEAIAQTDAASKEAAPTREVAERSGDKVADARPAKTKPASKGGEPATRSGAPPGQTDRTAEAEKPSKLGQVVAMLADRFRREMKSDQPAKSAEPELEDQPARRAPSVASQLRHGVRVSELQVDDVDAEPVQITLTAATPDEQNELAWALRAFFARNQIDDAEMLGRSAKLNESQAFYLNQRGEPKREATPPPQFIVRATPEQVASLVEDFGRSAPKDTQVALATPEIQTTGWRRSIEAAQMLQTQMKSPRLADARDRAESRRITGKRGRSAKSSSYGTAGRGVSREGFARGGYGGGSGGGHGVGTTQAVRQRSKAGSEDRLAMAQAPAGVEQKQRRSRRQAPKAEGVNKLGRGPDKRPAQSDDRARRAQWLASRSASTQTRDDTSKAKQSRSSVSAPRRLAAAPPRPEAIGPALPVEDRETPTQTPSRQPRARDATEADEPGMIVLPSSDDAAKADAQPARTGQLTQGSPPAPASPGERRSAPASQLAQGQEAKPVVTEPGPAQSQRLPMGPSELPRYRQAGPTQHQQLVTVVITVRTAEAESKP